MQIRIYDDGASRRSLSSAAGTRGTAYSCSAGATAVATRTSNGSLTGSPSATGSIADIDSLDD